MMQKKDAALRVVAVAALVGLATLTPASAKVLATVNGADISDDDVRTATEDLGPTLPAQLTGPAREAYVVDYLIDLKLAAQRAAQDKLGDIVLGFSASGANLDPSMWYVGRTHGQNRHHADAQEGRHRHGRAEEHQQPLGRLCQHLG